MLPIVIAGAPGVRVWVPSIKAPGVDGEEGRIVKGRGVRSMVTVAGMEGLGIFCGGFDTFGGEFSGKGNIGGLPLFCEGGIGSDGRDDGLGPGGMKGVVTGCNTTGPLVVDIGPGSGVPEGCAGVVTIKGAWFVNAIGGSIAPNGSGTQPANPACAFAMVDGGIRKGQQPKSIHVLPSATLYLGKIPSNARK